MKEGAAIEVEEEEVLGSDEMEFVFDEDSEGVWWDIEDVEDAIPDGFDSADSDFDDDEVLSGDEEIGLGTAPVTAA